MSLVTALKALTYNFVTFVMKVIIQMATACSVGITKKNDDEAKLQVASATAVRLSFGNGRENQGMAF
ncbi:hypothetical protein [Musicola keenii]|uniref:hypothetical protein n=1 Tax=Musicola keenii TaxID=2884250 RepID=UPI001785E2FC|nr:hypothetical protein [Musicola keenii]